MDPSDPEGSPSRRGRDHSSGVASPTDNRNPGRAQSTAGRDEGLSESFQSTDTVRRRPEGGYGVFTSFFDLGQYVLTALLQARYRVPPQRALARP